MHFAICFSGMHGIHCLVWFSSLFSLRSGCVDFSGDPAKQRLKNSWRGLEVSKNDFCVYFFFWCVFPFVLIYSFHAVQRHARNIRPMPTRLLMLQGCNLEEQS